MWRRHRNTSISHQCRIGTDTMIWRGCEVHSNVEIGKRCTIGALCTIFSGAVIGDDCKIEGHTDIFNGITLGNNVFVGPSVVFTNDLTPRAGSPKSEVVKTTVCDGVSIGANSTIVCGITIGEGAAIAAGSVVIHNVKPYELVAGNPASFLRHVCKCNRWGKLIPIRNNIRICEHCGATYQVEEGDLIPVDNPRGAFC